MAIPIFHVRIIASRRIKSVQVSNVPLLQTPPHTQIIYTTPSLNKKLLSMALPRDGLRDFSFSIHKINVRAHGVIMFLILTVLIILYLHFVIYNILRFTEMHYLLLFLVEEVISNIQKNLISFIGFP